MRWPVISIASLSTLFQFLIVIIKVNALILANPEQSSSLDLWLKWNALLLDILKGVVNALERISPLYLLCVRVLSLKLFEDSF